MINLLLVFHHRPLLPGTRGAVSLQYLVLVFPQLLLDLLHGAVDRPPQVAGPLGGHEIVLMFGRNPNFDDRRVVVLQIDGHSMAASRSK